MFAAELVIWRKFPRPGLNFGAEPDSLG